MNGGVPNIGYILRLSKKEPFLFRSDGPYESSIGFCILFILLYENQLNIIILSSK